jgi:hypothetical protein
MKRHRMEIGMEDLAILVYNYAVVLSAAYIPVLSGVDDRFVLLGGGFVLALFWTGYFQYRIRPQLIERDGTRSWD